MSKCYFVPERLHVAREDGLPLGHIEQADVAEYLFFPEGGAALDYDTMSQIQYQLSELNGGNK